MMEIAVMILALTNILSAIVIGMIQKRISNIEEKIGRIERSKK